MVGALNERLWNCEAEALRGLEIDHQLKLGRLLDRQISGFSPFQDFVDIEGTAPIKIVVIGAVAHQATSRHVVFEMDIVGRRCLRANSATRCLSARKIAVPSTRTAWARARAMVAKAPSNSAGVRTPTACSRTPSVRPASSSA